MAEPRIRVPRTVERGVPFQVRSLVTHRMESGQREDAQGEPIPRMIINRVVATFNGVEVFSADWHGAISANPYLAFWMRADESGELVLRWTDDSGETMTARARIEVR